MSAKRSLWGSKLGFLLAAIGSAVGLGNIWRFGYVAYENGGGAFLVPYTVALVVAGIPLMILEYALGHREKASPPLAFARVHRLWEPLGWWMPIIAFFGINLFYVVVIGWCMNYFCFSFDLSWGDNPAAFFNDTFLQAGDVPFCVGEHASVFGTIRLPILVSTILTWFICWFICFREVSHGIEKASMFFMPLLFVMTLILVGWSVQLDGAWEAIRENYLKCDFKKISLATQAGRQVWISAFGQIFFTLSLGFGIMITYASYLPKKTDIVGNALITCVLDCLYSFITGFAIFGTIGYMAQATGKEFGDVITAGPGLAFVVYPEAISNLPAGNRLFGAVFFFVLIVAGLSSAISLTEAFVCSICDKFTITRKKATSIICGAGLLGSIVFTTQSGVYILDIVDHYVNNYALILGGIFECVLVGWVVKAWVMRKHINECGTLKLPAVWDILIRLITPTILSLILGGALLNEFSGRYGNFSLSALLLIGAGTLIATRLAAFVLSHVKWSPEKLAHDHQPEEDHLIV